jgi:Fe-S cluster assembly protein SufD
MNIHAKPQLTPAETALIEAFVARSNELPGDGELMLKRDDAIERVKAGLPNRRVEAWHYTDLRRLLSSVPEFDPAARAESPAPLVADSVLLPVLGGRAAASKVTPDGLAALRVEELLTEGALNSRLVPQDAADAVGAINSAFAADGFAIDVAAGAVLEAPVELQNVHAGGQTHTRHVVTVGNGARVTLVERQTGTADALVSSVSHLTVGEGAEVLWVILQDQPKGASHLGQFNATVGKDAKLTLFVMNEGGKLVRQEIRVTAAGENCVFTLRGVNLLAGDTHTDVTMVLEHVGYGASSTEVVRNVVLDKAQGVFQGQIRVAREAQKTDARMACNTLLLSDEGEFSIKPELEIFADDVACGHGATVAEIHKDHLFYLMARGIPEKEARGLLVKAFLAEVIEDLSDEALVEALELRLDAWFVEHG